MTEYKEIRLGIGESHPLKSGIMTKSSLFYAGMPNKETYSLVISFGSGYQAMAYNLYYPLSRKQFTAGGKSFQIYSVTPDELRFVIT